MFKGIRFALDLDTYLLNGAANANIKEGRGNNSWGKRTKEFTIQLFIARAHLRSTKHYGVARTYVSYTYVRTCSQKK